VILFKLSIIGKKKEQHLAPHQSSRMSSITSTCCYYAFEAFPAAAFALLRPVSLLLFAFGASFTGD